MANFALLWKARIIEKYRSEYEKEKINSVLQTNVEVPKNTLMQKWSHYSYNTKKRLVKKFKHLCPEGSSVFNLLVYLTTDQTFPNFLMKSIIGFIGGIVFTYLCFMFFVFQLSISLMHATIMSSIIGVLLTLGLAFSYRVRCLVFLLIPQFFSRVGRYTLTCYALVLILTGPATNTLKNSEVLSESMACHQEQIKTSVKDITDSIKNPFNAMKDWIETMTEGIKGIAKKLKTTLVTTHRLVISIEFKSFASRVQSLLCVKIHVHHSYSFSSNASRSASQVAAGIVTEIRNRADPLLTWLSWSSCVTSLFLLLIIFRAKKYQHMYDTRSRFDNRYITKELRNLDFERLKEGKETVLPLNRREKAKYITTTSFRLLASEKVYLTRSIVHMVITTFKLLIHMAADYSLYWVLMTIRYHERFQTPLQPGPTNAGVHVSGSGPVAEMLRSLIGFLTLPLSAHPSSTVSCLPNPDPPDLYRYTQIGVLIFLLWFFALFEPYGLRLSHVIMGHYRPERAKARALWLYNHILKSRGGFMKFARRKLHKEYKYFNKDNLTFVEWLDSILPCWWLRCLLGTLPKEPNCLLCGTFEEPNKLDSKLVRCDTPKCPGVYCEHCFNDLGQLCTICLNPADYGDLSDVSLEKGSSEDSNSDCQDFDELMDAEDVTNFRHAKNIINKPKNICERFELLPKKQIDTRDCFLTQTKSNYVKEDSLTYKNGRRPLAELNGNQRKANIIGHFNNGYQFDMKFETNLMPLTVSSKQYNNLYPSSTYYPTSMDEKVEKWRISKHNVNSKLNNYVPKNSKGCSDYPSPKSSYYEIKFKSSSLTVSRVAHSNKIAKNLRHNYKSIFRCSSKDRKSNSRLFANETDYCSCDYNFIEPQNISDYCKSSCFIKSSKSESNSKQTLDNKKTSKTPQDESNKEEVSKNNEGNDNNASGQGDKQEPNKPESKSTCRCIKRMRRLCFCRHRKFSFTPCSVFKKMFRNNKKASPRSQKTNHKKRKKNSHSSSRKSDENTKRDKDDEAARIYRLSEYIGQQDWKKTQFSKSNHLELKKRKIFRTNSAKSLHRLKLHSGSKMVDVVNISKVKQKKKNNTKLINAIEDVIAGQETDIELKSNSKKMTITTAENTANSVSDYGMSRSLRYYCSIGNTEFDQIDWPDAFKTRGLTKHLLKKEEGTLKSLKGESEASPYHSCCCSSEASSVTFNFKTEFEMLSKPVRGIKLKSIKHIHIKAKMKYSIVKRSVGRPPAMDRRSGQGCGRILNAVA
ncbi:DC-STAMP domain-containing protein 1 [Papilio xuthus]|uniref:DC-STAMP domain-containing protein 1 n=1 Tax=Papilio xuthus TaxID=66420 RepID=A0A0N1IB13_PAPXU|nr:DC-STAMP domain-containing protein 1 [Papilio xuthus]